MIMVAWMPLLEELEEEEGSGSGSGSNREVLQIFIWILIIASAAAVKPRSPLAKVVLEEEDLRGPKRWDNAFHLPAFLSTRPCAAVLPICCRMAAAERSPSTYLMP
jgi:hypothetical protein